MNVAERLAALGLELPAGAPAAANYLPFVQHGDLVLISGQLPMESGAVAVTGKLGAGVSGDDGRRAARLCALGLLGQIRTALDGDWERLERIVRITGFVSSAPESTEQHIVVNGASDLLVEVLGDRGRHARAAVGVAVLPLDAAVEVDAIVALR